MLNVIHFIYVALTWILWLYSLFIVIDAILSWVPMLSNSVIGRFLGDCKIVCVRMNDSLN